MATRYHVNPVTGDYGVCRAEKGKCPFGGTTGNENHFATEKEARKASETIYAGLNEQNHYPRIRSIMMMYGVRIIQGI